MLSEVDRYTTPTMTHIWSPNWKFERWAEIEIKTAEALGASPMALAQMRDAEVPLSSEVDAEEKKTRHDVVAFLNLWRESMGEQGRSWTHLGLTSSDIVDTANGLRMKASTDVVRSGLFNLTKLVVDQARHHRNTVRVGRTHGQHAEVTTWGWRLAVFAFDLIRAERRLATLSPLYEVGKLSGPVGDYKGLSSANETSILLNLGLSPTGASTQIVSRDVYVDYVHALAQVASVIENMAMEIRLSSRTEVGEMRELFGQRQRGSSSMPHKRNPIKSEQLCGLARVVRAQVEAVAAGVAVHHERDISHSSVERIALPLASNLVDYMLTEMHVLLRNLRVYPATMRKRAMESTEVLSAYVKDQLINSGYAPDHAYDIVFWGFEDWLRPVEDRGPDSEHFETLAEALQSSWRRVTEQHGSTYAELDAPDFETWSKVLENPEQLIGDTDAAYSELNAFVSPDLPF